MLFAALCVATLLCVVPHEPRLIRVSIVWDRITSIHVTPCSLQRSYLAILVPPMNNDVIQPSVYTHDDLHAGRISWLIFSIMGKVLTPSDASMKKISWTYYQSRNVRSCEPGMLCFGETSLVNSPKGVSFFMLYHTQAYTTGPGLSGMREKNA